MVLVVVVGKKCSAEKPKYKYEKEIHAGDSIDN